jgi:hypothetical protein
MYSLPSLTSWCGRICISQVKGNPGPCFRSACLLHQFPPMWPRIWRLRVFVFRLGVAGILYVCTIVSFRKLVGHNSFGCIQATHRPKFV